MLTSWVGAGASGNAVDTFFLVNSDTLKLANVLCDAIRKKL